MKYEKALRQKHGTTQKGRRMARKAKRTKSRAEQNVVRVELKEQLHVTWHKVRFLQMSERRRLPKLAENNKLVSLKEEVNDIIKELLEENVTDVIDVNRSTHAAVTVITETVTQLSKTM
jgi:hypothetical protein